ncbi:MAG: hypothetical protein ACP5PM_10880, partial [Acidimicrobiales bacterium]
MAPEVYKSFVMQKDNKKAIYVQVLRALYVMLVAELLCSKKFRSDLEQQGFVFNPVNKKQHTLRFHVDDLISSHVDTKINDNFVKWLNKMYGLHDEVKTTRGKVHDYLIMVFDFSQEGQIKVDMVEYITNMVEEFPMILEPTDMAPTLVSDDLFAEGDGPKLD